LEDLFYSRLIQPPTVPDDNSVDLSGDGYISFLKNKVWADEFHEKFPDSKDQDNILSYLRSKQAAYANLETSVASFKPLAQQMEESGQKLDNISTELAAFMLAGFDDVIVLSEQKWSKWMLIRSAVVIAFGIAQVVVGVVIQLKTAGLMTNVAAGFISEGISDILFAVSALRSGNNFSWGDYGRHKIESIVITVGAIGVGCLLTRGVKFFKYGYKVAGPALQGASTSTSVVSLGWKAVAQEAAKITASKIARSAAVSLINQGVHMVVTEYLKKYCHSLANKLHSFLQDKFRDVEQLKETIRSIYRKFGHSATGKINEIVAEIFAPGGSSWFDSIDKVPI
jgi:hypothetical protein